MSGPSFARLRAAAVAAAASALVLVISVPAARAVAPEFAQRQFTLMTQNLYLGTNLTPLFASADIVTATTVYHQVVQTDFPDRAQAIAREIVAKHPDVIGLQEVALWQKAPLTSPTPPPLGTMPAAYDFLDILLQALADRGAPYEAVAVNVNFNPSDLAALGGAVAIIDPTSPSGLSWVSFTDRDAIIVRSDLPTSELRWSNPTSENFVAKLPVTIGENLIQVPRGWSTVDVTIRGKTYRVADTHLEAYSEVVRNLQATELAGTLTASPLPVVLAGDLNSRPTDSGGAYGTFADAGFVDSWPEAMGSAPGNTSGQSDAQPDPLDCAVNGIDHRIDYVLHSSPGGIDAVTGTGDVVGDETTDCVDPGPFGYPLWPSDHAGVAVVLHVAKP